MLKESLEAGEPTAELETFTASVIKANNELEGRVVREVRERISQLKDDMFQRDLAREERLNLQKENIKSIFLMGNHEQVMIDFLFNKINNLRYWLSLGADQTFKSYDIEVAEFIKDGFGDKKIEKLRNVFLNQLTY